MNQEHGQSQEGEAIGIRGIEDKQDVYPHTDCGEALSGVSGRTGSQRLGLNRKDSPTGVGDFNPFGGVIDQLIDDAKKQLVKSQECIIWYREEAKEYQNKLENLTKLKELQQQQHQQMKELQQQETDNEDQVNLDEDLLNLE